MVHIFMNVIHLLFVTLVVAKQIWPRVVGGEVDTGKEFPFAVMIQEAEPPTHRVCSGSIIAPVWVLTAGHCIPNRNQKRRVKYGDTTIPSNETKFLAKVIKGVPHPGFRIYYHDVRNDIGLLKTEKMATPTLGKLYTLDYRGLMGLQVKYAGFGRTMFLLPSQRRPGGIDLELDGPDGPLLMGEAVVVSCKQDGWLSSGRPAICVAPRCGSRQKIASGDSGAPLLLNGCIIGVANGYASYDVPVMGFSPVSPHLDWIYDTILAD